MKNLGGAFLIRML